MLTEYFVKMYYNSLSLNYVICFRQTATKIAANVTRNKNVQLKFKEIKMDIFYGIIYIYIYILYFYLFFSKWFIHAHYIWQLWKFVVLYVI